MRIAYCEDGLYRCAVTIDYYSGGYMAPIRQATAGYATIAEARTAGLECLLRCFPTPFPSEPTVVYADRDELRRQIEAQLKQPSLF